MNPKIINLAKEVQALRIIPSKTPEQEKRLNDQTADLCRLVLEFSDDDFQPKIPVEDVTEICRLATSSYKNTEYTTQVRPMVLNLLAQLDKETIIKAIENVSKMFDQNDRPHDKRPGFARQFMNAEAVKEMAEREVEEGWLS